MLKELTNKNDSVNDIDIDTIIHNKLIKSDKGRQ